MQKLKNVAIKIYYFADFAKNEIVSEGEGGTHSRLRCFSAVRRLRAGASAVTPALPRPFPLQPAHTLVISEGEYYTTATRYFCRLFRLGKKGRGNDAFKQPIVDLNHLFTK